MLLRPISRAAHSRQYKCTRGSTLPTVESLSLTLPWVSRSCSLLGGVRRKVNDVREGSYCYNGCMRNFTTVNGSLSSSGSSNCSSISRSSSSSSGGGGDNSDTSGSGNNWMKPRAKSLITGNQYPKHGRVQVQTRSLSLPSSSRLEQNSEDDSEEDEDDDLQSGGSLFGDFDVFNPTDVHRSLRETMQDFVTREVDPQALEYNRDEKFNIELFRKCGELGLLGATVPTQYGGAGLDAVASCIIHEELSTSDPAFCLSYLAHSLLFVNNLAQNGNEEQKLKWLPDACNGTIIGGMCMSEPDYGTDVLGMKTTAKPSPDGGYVLNGTKMWITNGAIDDDSLGDVFLVYAKTPPVEEVSVSTEKETGGEGKAKSSNASAKPGVSLFLVEKGTPGFSLGQRIKEKCGMRASPTAELVFEDVKLPPENLVGQYGGAVSCMMKNLEIERVGLAAMSTGIGMRAVETINRYSDERVAFGKPLKEFGQIQRHLGESYAKLKAGRYFLYQVAGKLDLNELGNRLDTDAVKLFCTTMGKDVADAAIQCLGGNGYIGEYGVERLWRDSKLLEIGGGTLESHHKNIARELRNKRNIT